MIWETERVLRAFAEREPDHPHFTTVQQLIELGRDDPHLNLSIGPEVIALWRALHGEIV